MRFDARWSRQYACSKDCRDVKNRAVNPTKPCCRCHSSLREGLSAYCRACKNARGRKYKAEWVKTHRRHVNESRRAWWLNRQAPEYRRCAECKIAFVKTPGVRSYVKYCSAACRREATRRINRANQKPRRQVRKCRWCRSEFTSASMAQRYCSDDCSFRGHTRQQLRGLFAKAGSVPDDALAKMYAEARVVARDLGLGRV